MPTATLLLREATSTSLNVIVEKSQLKKPPLPEYDLQLNSSHLNLVLVSPLPEKSPKSLSSDEGFESDIDSLSLISSDDSFTVPALGNVSKTPETDSANGSACSDTEDADTTSTKTLTLVEDYPDSTPKATARKDSPQEGNENYDLVNCVCYSDVKFPNLLVFVIKQEALVFKFVDLEALQKFYTSFNALKAVANQKAYFKDKSETKFNLLQRTDHNGITHIEISREPRPKPTPAAPTTRVISINTPDNYIDQRILNKMIKQKPLQVDAADCGGLVKKWNSSENLLESSQKTTERRKRVKGKAPPPPPPPSPPLVEQKQHNVLKGEYVQIGRASCRERV